MAMSCVNVNVVFFLDAAITILYHLLYPRLSGFSLGEVFTSHHIYLELLKYKFVYYCTLHMHLCLRIVLIY